MDVWLLKSDDYPSDVVTWGIFSSVEKAAKYLRDLYGEPYIVKWDEPVKLDDELWSVTGHFTGVPGYCGSGPSGHFVQRYALDPVAE